MGIVNAFIDFLVTHRDLVTENRPLRLRVDHPRMMMEDVLLPQRVQGTETLCGGFEYRVLCVALDAQLPLKEFIAQPAAIDIVTDRGRLRSVCGIVTEAWAGESDGGLASYQLVIRDALAVLEKRTNTRVFRNLNEVDIVRRLVAEWQRNNSVLGPVFSIETDDIFAQTNYPPREFTMQHNETDGAFMRRLLKRRGIAWCFRPDEAERYPKHQLILMNRFESARQSTAGIVRYHRDASTEERDAVTGWNGIRRLQPRVATRHSWDYRTPWAPELMQVRLDSDADQGPSGADVGAAIDDHLVLPPHAGDDPDDLTALGTLAMKRHDFETKCFTGEGSVRDFRAGEYFELTGHPEIDRHPQMEREFVVTELHLTVKNNLPRDLAERVSKVFQRSGWANEDLDQRPVRMRFTAVRRGVPLVPAYDPRADLPPVHMQSAIVVGPAQEEVHCDALGRVRIRFPATREPDHKHASNVGASNTEHDSAWVRVASSWAGNGPGHSQCGSLSLPRVGSEVLVAFLGGDPDKPVIVGQVYNQRAMPPALSSGGGLPGNRYLSGIRSREVQGGQGSQLRFDDTTGEISAQLASDHAQSQLNLGCLTQPRKNGYSEKRGEGAELRSDQQVAIRGQQGVLVTAESSDGETGRHLDRAGMLALADGLQKLARELSDRATQHAGDRATGEALQQLIDAVRNLSDNGSPTVAVSAPAGLLASSGKNIAIGAATDVDVLSGSAVNIGAGDTVSVRASQGASIFANEGGMKLTAACGKVSMQAQNDQLELIAQKVLEIISNTDWITIKAKRGVRINGGGTELELSAGGIKGYTSGKHHMYAADHQTFPGKDKQMQFPGDKPVHKICVPCLRIAAQAHSPFAPSK